MTKKSLVWSTVFIASLFVVSAGLTQNGWPRAQAQQVFPGGRAAKIRSYHLAGYATGTYTIVPTIEGEHGFVVTDVAVTTRHYYAYLELREGTTPKAALEFGAHASSYDGAYARPTAVHLNSGIVFSPGASLNIYMDQGFGFTVTISGYVF